MANERARALRKTMSEAERKLWRQLRRGEINGYRFRRQHPIGVYVADFVCLERRLVIEVDGGQHGEPEKIAHDARRTAWLEAQGFRVLRSWTGEVRGNIDGVLEAISKALAQPASERRRPPPPRHAKDELGRA